MFNVYLYFAVDGGDERDFLDLFLMCQVIFYLDFPVQYPFLYFRKSAIVAYFSS